jgi:hypothetical protein
MDGSLLGLSVCYWWDLDFFVAMTAHRVAVEAKVPLREVGFQAGFGLAEQYFCLGGEVAKLPL